MAAATAQVSKDKKVALPGRGDSLEGMTKMQKLASFLVMVGPEVAVKILGEFGEKEVEDITAEIAKTDFVPLHVQKALVKEFAGITVEAVTRTEGGPQVARTVLEKSLGSYRAGEVMSRVSPQRFPVFEKTSLREIPPRQLAGLLANENPQTCALVLSNLDTGRCAQIFALLDSAKQTEVAERIATMEPVSSEILNEVLNYLQGRLSGQKMTGEVTHSGGAQILADILNAIDDDASQQILMGLEGKNPELSNSIKKLLFRFEEIIAMDKQAIGKVLREIDSQMLSVALRNASKELKAHVLSAMSKRAAESLEEEMRFMAPVRLKEIELMQDKIIEVIRRLESNGDIVLQRKKSRAGGGNELI